MTTQTPVDALLATRRQWLLRTSLLAGGAAAWAATPRAWAQAAPGLGHGAGGGRLVVVFLRGAYDGLSAFVPFADPTYAQLRQSTRIPAPDGSALTALRLNDTFALHPALAPVLPMWQDGTLAVVPASGSPLVNRSHFDAQYQMEVGLPGRTSDSPGWLNRLAGLTVPRNGLIGVGEANPAILGGPVTARLIPRGQQATNTGVLANPQMREALMDLYKGDDRLSAAFRQGAASRMDSAQELQRGAMLDRERAAALGAVAGGADSAVGLALDAQQLARLMRAEPTLRIGFLSAGGWDTHANQGGVEGLLANNLGNLARALVQLRADFNQPGDTVVVMSEFGRTAAENGTRGTDHGHGNAMWVMGQRVAGGRVQGRWEGLARGSLNEGRDLPVLNDYRSVLAQVLARGFGLADSRLQDLFPGARWDSGLDALMRRG
jgi:uncharacterized protein (DUF1501 family)